MADFLTIAEAKAAMKGSFVGVVITAGDLKSGTKDGKDWSKKVYQIQDATATVPLTTWNDDIAKFKIGGKYEIVNPWWKEYQGNVQLELGKYCEVKLVGTDEIPKPGQFHNETPEQGTAHPIEGEPEPKLPELSANSKQVVSMNTALLAQIEQEVKATLKDLGITDMNGQKIGLYVKLNFEDLKRLERG